MWIRGRKLYKNGDDTGKVRLYFRTNACVMPNRLLLVLSIILVLLGSACQNLRHSFKAEIELPVNETQERVNLMGKPIDNKPDASSKNEMPVSKPAEQAPGRREKAVHEPFDKDSKSKRFYRQKAVKDRKVKAVKKDRKPKANKLAEQRNEQSQSAPPRKPASDLLFSESKGLGFASREIETVIRTAETYLGVPYRWGGMSRAGVDCSGLMVLAFQSAGLSIPRVSGDQYAKGKSIKKAEIRPGDLLFFSSGRPGVIGHTALVVAVKGGSIKFIHATSGYGVRYDYLESEHWSKLYIGASRYL